MNTQAPPLHAGLFPLDQPYTANLLTVVRELPADLETTVSIY
jgi:hypothetical protein